MSDLNPVKPEDVELTHSTLGQSHFLWVSFKPQCPEPELLPHFSPASGPALPAVTLHNDTIIEYFADINMVTKQSDSTGDITAAFLVMLKRYRIKSHFFFLHSFSGPATYTQVRQVRFGDAE